MWLQNAYAMFYESRAQRIAKRMRGEIGHEWPGVFAALMRTQRAARAERRR